MIFKYYDLEIDVPIGHEWVFTAMTGHVFTSEFKPALTTNGWNISLPNAKRTGAILIQIEWQNSLRRVTELTPIMPVRNETTATSILNKAVSHMNDRAATYDKPDGERSMASTVAAFNAVHGTNLTETQGWHFLATLKQVRFFQNDKYHADSVEDCAAYIALMGESKCK